ncbi:MAG: hypothetical protein IPM52_08165 [Bacteroidetes bacterium]|nr:hypothetical protein [Bacteroidota bacterium]
MKRNLILAFILLMITFSSVGQESQQQSMDEPADGKKIGLSFGAKAGTTGFGGELGFAVTPSVHLRLGGSYFRYDIELEAFQSEVEGSSFVKVGAISLLANLHPARYFYVSAGVLYNLFEAGIYGIPANPITIGNIQATPDEVGYLEANFKPGMTINPYAGIGFGRAVSKNRRLSFNIDLGAAFMDSPKADLISTGMLTPTSSEEQKRQLNENIAWLQFYPILNFQLNFRIL